MERKDTLRVGERLVDLKDGAVMAILNVTPDSFFTGSRVKDADDLRRRVDGALEAGAALLDLGGYSSRPGAEEVTESEELKRLSGAMAVVRKEYPDAVLSVDTFRSGVVKALVREFGPFVVNDISAGELDAEMFGTVAEYGLPYVIMHMRGSVQGMMRETDYGDVVEELLRYFVPKLGRLAGLGAADVMVDPGFGFSKDVRTNFELLKRLNELRVLDRPLLAGLSRKTMIWKTLGVTPAGALNGTTALHWEALRQGASVLRAHDVREAVETLRLYRAWRDA